MASIREIAQKIKAHSAFTVSATISEWGLFLLVILAVTAAFGLGRLSVLMAPKSPLLVQNTASAAIASIEETGSTLGLIQGAYLGSSTGHLYYFPWCAAASKIPPEMRRWFIDEKAAVKAGYQPASNCKGMGSP